MIDSLKIRLNDYELKEEHKFLIQPGLINSKGEILQENILTKISEKNIYGSKAYYNSEFFNCTMHGLQQDLTQNNILIQLSLPRFYSKTHNLLSLDYKKTKDCIKELQKELNETGIKTNILNSTILRLDSFKNIETDKDFSYYKDIFSILHLSKKKERDYGSTMLYMNSDSQICIYDKIEEMKFKYKSKVYEYLPNDNNVIRFENRLIKKRKVLSELNYNDLETMITKDGYNQIIDNYYSTMKKNIFKLDKINDIEYYCNNEIKEELNYFFKIYGKNYLEHWLKFKGFENIAKFAKFETIVNTMKEIEIERGYSNNSFNQKKYRLKEIFNDYSIIKKVFETSNNKDNFSMYSLYSELETKMFKKVS